MQINKLVLHVSDVASLLGVSSKTIYGLIQDDKLKAYKEGRSLKIPMASVEAYIQSRLRK